MLQKVFMASAPIDEKIAVVSEELKRAGATLNAMPAHGCYPQDAKAYWPQIVPEASDYADMKAIPKPPRPAPDDITHFDTWVERIKAIPEEPVRWVVAQRLLIDAGTGKAKRSFQDLARARSTNKMAMHRRYKDGLKYLAYKYIN